MKFVPYRNGDVKSHELFKIVASRADQQGGTKGIEDVRARIRVLDALDKYPPESHLGVTFEDAEWTLLKRLIDDFPYAAVSRALMDVIDDVHQAKAPESHLKAVESS